MIARRLTLAAVAGNIARPYLASVRFFSGPTEPGDVLAPPPTTARAVAGAGGMAVATGPPSNPQEAWRELVRSTVYDLVGLGFAGVAMYMLVAGQANNAGFAAAVGLAGLYLGNRTAGTLNR